MPASASSAKCRGGCVSRKSAELQRPLSQLRNESNRNALRTAHATTNPDGVSVARQPRLVRNPRALVFDLQAALSCRTPRSNLLVHPRTECASTLRALCSSCRAPQTTRPSLLLRIQPRPPPVEQRRSPSEMRLSREDRPSERNPCRWDLDTMLSR